MGKGGGERSPQTEPHEQPDPDDGPPSSDPPQRRSPFNPTRLLEGGKVFALATAVLTMLVAVVGLVAFRSDDRGDELAEANQRLADERDVLAAELDQALEQLFDLEEQLRTTTTTRTTAPSNAPRGVDLVTMEPVSGTGGGIDAIDPGDAVTSNGVPYAQALVGSVACSGTAGSSAQYSLGRDFSRFTTTVGLSDDSSPQSSGSFTVYLDDEPVARGDVTTGMSLAVDADVTNGMRLRLEIVPRNTPDQLCDPAGSMVFGNPRLVP